MPSATEVLLGLFEVELSLSLEVVLAEVSDVFVAVGKHEHSLAGLFPLLEKPFKNSPVLVSDQHFPLSQVVFESSLHNVSVCLVVPSFAVEQEVFEVPSVDVSLTENDPPITIALVLMEISLVKRAIFVDLETDSFFLELAHFPEIHHSFFNDQKGTEHFGLLSEAQTHDGLLGERALI